MVILTMASVQEQGENEQKKQEFNAVYCSCPSRQTAWQYIAETSTIINKTHATSCAAKQNIASTAITYNWFYS